MEVQSVSQSVTHLFKDEQWSSGISQENNKNITTGSALIFHIAYFITDD